ncbi:phage tail protein [Xenophilus sp. Marseille-Q4582]|uniref:phage tail protein n=1 Tax=Xenophilus sp. Marseille-Q4582 TaxID=2866600 RepID=UPI001CE3F323|nr:phage tail protein [Xenophilus sp. Marseille-Q4582]
MAARLPDGSTVAIATAYGSPKAVTAVTNANPAVATSAAHGLANGALIEVTSGWQRVNDRIVRVANQASGTFELEGINSLATQYYPAGSGVGSVREITTFTQISQILDFTTSGGEQQFATYSFLEEDFERQLPTVTSAQSISIGIADDPSLPGYQALKAAGEARAVRALRLTLPDGSLILYNGTISFNETPTLTKGSVMQVTATVSLQGRPVRYSA